MLYVKLKRKEKDIKELQDLGVVAPTWLRNLEIFEYFSDLDEKLCVYCKYELTAEVFGLSSETVKKIVSKMKK